MNNYYSNNASIKYYEKNRLKINHLYKSEKNFFLSKTKKSKSFLDLGCAIGNFVNIISEIKKKKFQYLGLDNQKKLIKIAKKKYPNYDFNLIKDHKFLIKKKYDFVFSLGVLHHVKDWKSYILSMKKSSKKYLLFDVRLTDSKTINSIKQFQKITFGKKWDGHSKIRYITINKFDFHKFLKKNFKNYKIHKKEYLHKVGKGYVGVYKKVIMTTILCEKN